MKHKPLLTDDQRDLWRSYVRVQAALTRKLDDSLRAETGMGLNALELLWLLAIADGNRVRMTDVADHLVFTRSGVTRLVARLERDGLVTRECADDDLRGRYATLTRKGFDVFEDAARCHVDALRELFFSELDDRRAKQLKSVLARLGARLSDD